MLFKKSLRQINIERRKKYVGEPPQQELMYLNDLQERFRNGDIDTADLLAAFDIMQDVTATSKHTESNYDIIDLLCRCCIEIMDKGNVKLSAACLNYIGVTLPAAAFIDEKISMLHQDVVDGFFDVPDNPED